MGIAKFYINNMKKLIFITPHLSTGGAPQYLLQKIKELNNIYEIYCIEYANVTGGVLVVQRNQIQELLKDKLITLHENKNELVDYIKKINPFVIHFEELPEYFCDDNVARKIYVSNRTYKIIETSHDSSFDISNKRFFPDRFIFVSEYQKRIFSKLNIPSDIVEYPIIYKQKTDRVQSLLDLGLDPDKTHILNVGLFTPRKNQAEIVQYAKQLINENVQFHFVGNQADNFKYYWEPIMKDFPSNCKWWNERKDVDTFYNAMDVFLFTSKGTNSDKETSPLVLKEALGWKMPILMYNLPVYCGMYNKYENISWLNHKVEENIKLIKNYIKSSNNLFTFNFNENDNKIDVYYNGQKYINNVLFSIKDIDSKSCIYSFKSDLSPNSSLWFIPLPKNYYDFKNNINFGGFVIEVYNEKSELLFEKQLRLKKINIEKPIIDFSNEEPIFVNYNEFFVDKIYDDLNIKNLEVCVDIGANVGLFTKYLKYNGCKKIFCFEPNIKAFNYLQNNLRYERDVEIFNLAVSHDTKPIKLYIDGNNTLISSGCKKTDSFYEVNVIQLSDIISNNKIKHIDLLKIDIEGMEFDLIQNTRPEVFDVIRAMLIEYHDQYFEDGDVKLNNLKNQLTSYGYQIYSSTTHKFICAIKNI